MRAGDFLKNLRKLNPALQVCSFGDNKHLAGLFYIDKQDEYQDICGVDKNEVPEYSEWDEQGHMLVSGWRRVYLILLQLRLTTKEKVLKVCPGFFFHWSQARVDEDRRVRIVGDKVAAKIQQYSADAPRKVWRDPDTGRLEEGSILTDEQNLDIAKDIRAKDTSAEQEQAEKDRWFLRTWQDRGGLTSDKPKI